MAGKKRIDNKKRVLRDNEFQRSDGRYMFLYYVNGKKKYLYSWTLNPKDTPPKGKKIGLSLRELEENIKKEQFSGLDSAARRNQTLNDVFDVYISTKKQLKQSTKTNYLYMYDTYVRNEIGNTLIADIKYSDMVSFYNNLIDNGFKPNSLEIIQTILHPTFTLAVRNDFILKNPTDGIICELKKSHNWEKPKRHALTEEEQTAFVSFIKNSDTYKHWLPLFTVFLGTGCRVGELIGLTWKDVDMTNDTISINHNLIYRVQDNGKMEWHITTPKTEAGKRTIPMLQAVKNAIIEERQRQMTQGFCTQKIDGYSGFIFTNRFSEVHSPHAINRAIKRIYKAYNEQEEQMAQKEHREPLFIPHFSVHNLRHTFCTRF